MRTGGGQSAQSLGKLYTIEWVADPVFKNNFESGSDLKKKVESGSDFQNKVESGSDFQNKF